MAEKPEYSKALCQEIIRALGYEELDFNGLLSRLKGAQQQHVMPILEELVATKVIARRGFHYALIDPPPKPDWATTRARVIELLSSLPPGNPLAGQWWFNFDSAVLLAERVWHAHWGKAVAFLGTPVVGFAYAIATKQPCSIFEYDKDVVFVVQKRLAETRADVIVRDAFDSVPEQYRGRFEGIVCDPPWYQEYLSAFLYRCTELGEAGSVVYWSLAPLLTRPEAERERTDFLEYLAEIDCSILALDSASLTYVIPDFEAEAYRHIPGFHSKVWRKSDLLVFRFPGNPRDAKYVHPPAQRPVCLNASSYYDRCRGMRIFHLPERETDELPVPFREDKEFARTVSLSGHPSDHIALWSSRRRGFALSKLPSLPSALHLWQEGRPIEQIRETLESDGSSSTKDKIPEVIELLRLATASEEDEPKVIRRHDELSEREAKRLNETWATQIANRERAASPDPYRLEFQRDRDKILWSKAFKSLAGKTQVFPNFGDDRFRNRLTHTLEVAQIARTLARAFGLNEDLTEAIALAHDIGHTPFGHAGEEAINGFLCEILNKSCGAAQQRTTWFSHYEHGVDVLRWLDDIYFSPGAGRAAGLGVSIEVYDGVFKHMYHRWETSNGRRNKKSQEELYRQSKHKKVIPEGYSRLEGQSVRIADKICYLVQDLEDGILAGIINLADLSQCRLFSRPYIDLVQAPGDTQLHRYVSQRGEVINLLTKDTLEHTQVVLRELESWTNFVPYSEYAVRPSDEMAADISEVWTKVQVEILHKHPKVVGANARASRIVKTLLMLFTFSPNLVEPSFQQYFRFLEDSSAYMKAYEEAVGAAVAEIGKEAGSYFDAALAKDRAIKSKAYAYEVPLRNVIQAKDFVASLTDGQAMHFYENCAQSGDGPGGF